MADKLLMGTARPLFRYGNNRYVLNYKPSMIEIPLPFTEEYVPNKGVFSPKKLFKHSDGFRPEAAVTWQYLDRVSVETLLSIFENDEYFYMRPHFNFYKEYEMLCLNKGELTRINTTANPYKGTLLFTGRETVTTHPVSSGAFDFNGTTQIADTSLIYSIAGDITLELWIKTDAIFIYNKVLFESTSGTPAWSIQMDREYHADPDSAWSIAFWTGGTHKIETDYLMADNSWHFLQIRRIGTQKYILIDGVQKATGGDSFGTNNIVGVKLGDTTNGLTCLCQILRVFNDDLNEDYYSRHSIEALDATAYNNLKLWWDFSQGNANDLSVHGNDGTITGTETYSEESFPDNGQTYLT